jgi:hypothetical protein
MLGGLETHPLLAGTPRARSINTRDGKMPDKGADSEPAMHMQEQEIPLPRREEIRLMKPDEKAIAREHKAGRERCTKRLVPFLHATKGLIRGALQPGVREQSGEQPRSHGASSDTLVVDREHEAPLKMTMPVLHWADNMRHQIRDYMDMHLGDHGANIGPG